MLIPCLEAERRFLYSRLASSAKYINLFFLHPLREGQELQTKGVLLVLGQFMSYLGEAPYLLHLINCLCFLIS